MKVLNTISLIFDCGMSAGDVLCEGSGGAAPGGPGEGGGPDPAAVPQQASRSRGHQSRQSPRRGERFPPQEVLSASRQTQSRGQVTHPHINCFTKTFLYNILYLVFRCSIQS